MESTHKKKKAKLSEESSSKEINIGKGLNYVGSGIASTLFTNLLSNKTPKSCTISPVSIGIALVMTLEGSDGNTRAQIQKLFGLGDSELSQFSDSVKSFLSQTKETASEKLVIEIANSLWINMQDELKVFDSFKNKMTESFDAHITSIPFSSAMAPINSWCSEKTHGKITKIVSKAPQGPVLLLNAVYFKGQWEFQFDKKDTQTMEFHTHAGETVKVLMMHQSEKLPFKSNKKWSSVLLPYVGNKHSMLIVLPDKSIGIQGLLSEMKESPDDCWKNWMSSKKSSDKVGVWIPRWKVEFETSLASTLKQLGCGDMFSASANFSKMTNGPVYIDDVLHKTFVEVNEEGTEAAAVTAVTTKRNRATNPPVIKCDHPFLYAIIDNSTKCVLFVGVMLDPSA